MDIQTSEPDLTIHRWVEAGSGRHVAELSRTTIVNGQRIAKQLAHWCEDDQPKMGRYRRVVAVQADGPARRVILECGHKSPPILLFSWAEDVDKPRWCWDCEAER